MSIISQHSAASFHIGHQINRDRGDSGKITTEPQKHIRRWANFDTISLHPIQGS